MTANHDSDVEINVDRTIQWARESLQRRRSDLLKLKEKKNLTVPEDEVTSSSSVRTMLERGRALLAEAEAHSDILGKYASPSKADGARAAATSPSTLNSETNSRSRDLLRRSAKDAGFMTRFLEETTAKDNEVEVDEKSGKQGRANEETRELVSAKTNQRTH